MTDLIHVLPDFDIARFSHILPSLEKALITTNDILTLDALNVAKRAQIPVLEAQKLAITCLDALHASFAQSSPHTNGHHHHDRLPCVSTLDSELDAALDRGFPVGQLVELTGESAAGKTQLLLTILLSAQLSPPTGLGKTALYITTEGPLQTSRLAQILNHHPSLATLPPSTRPSLSRIQSIKVEDLETQDHVLRYQVPVAITRNDVGLIVIDSIAANYRAEFDSHPNDRSRIQALAERSQQLIRTGSWLRQLARQYNVAVVVANQVLDRFSTFQRPDSSHAISQGSVPSSARQDTRPEEFDTRPALLSTSDPLALDHQQRFFTGWGDMFPCENLKTPSLGLTWTNQLSARVVLLKQPFYNTSDLGSWKRSFKVVFASWCADATGVKGTPFEIWKGGVRSLPACSDGDKQTQNVTC